MEVVEADVVERLQLAGDVGGIGEEFERLADLHGEEVGNALALPADFERVFREPRPVADVAGHPHVCQKIHVEADRAVALAGLAPPAGHVEAESPRLPAPLLGLRQHCEQAADVVVGLFCPDLLDHGEKPLHLRHRHRRLHLAEHDNGPAADVAPDHHVDLLHFPAGRQLLEPGRGDRHSPVLLQQFWHEVTGEVLQAASEGVC